MPTQEWFEVRLMIAAEQARQAGFDQTYAALLDVLRASIHSDERMIGALSAPLPTVPLRFKIKGGDKPPQQTFTNR